MFLLEYVFSHLYTLLGITNSVESKGNLNYQKKEELFHVLSADMSADASADALGRINNSNVTAVSNSFTAYAGSCLFLSYRKCSKFE